MEAAEKLVKVALLMVTMLMVTVVTMITLITMVTMTKEVKMLTKMHANKNKSSYPYNVVTLAFVFNAPINAQLVWITPPLV